MSRLCYFHDLFAFIHVMTTIATLSEVTDYLPRYTTGARLRPQVCDLFDGCTICYVSRCGPMRTGMNLPHSPAPLDTSHEERSLHGDHLLKNIHDTLILQDSDLIVSTTQVHHSSI